MRFLKKPIWNLLLIYCTEGCILFFFNVSRVLPHFLRHELHFLSSFLFHPATSEYPHGCFSCLFVLFKRQDMALLSSTHLLVGKAYEETQQGKQAALFVITIPQLYFCGSSLFYKKILGADEVSS